MVEEQVVTEEFEVDGSTQQSLSDIYDAAAILVERDEYDVPVSTRYFFMKY